MTSDLDKVCVRLLISGRVQGVGYRFNTQQQAIDRELTGWVRNLADGRVEAEIEGPRAEVESMLIWCQSGPLAAEVRHIDVEDRSVQQYSTFVIRR